MKNTVKIRAFVKLGLIFIAGWFFSENATAQPRGSVWVHGFNSSGSSWSKWEQLFTAERQMFNSTWAGRPYTYNTTTGVPDAALSVRSSYPANQRTIYFGHSMGGVIGREIDVNFPNSFGGLIAFGSPFDGAQIANSVQNGAVNNFIANGVDKVTRGPARQLGITVFFIWNLIVDDVVRSIQNRLPINLPNNQGVTDLQEGSTYLQNGIRNSQTATHKIHVYGNEESPVLWRYASSTYEGLQGQPTYNDTYFVDFANTAGDVYEAAMWVNFASAAATGWFTFGIGSIYYWWLADGWMDGKNWWRYDSEAGWNNLIGAYTPATRNLCYTYVDQNYFMTCYNDYALFDMLDQIQNCYNWATVNRCYTYYSQVNGQSDGLIKAPSQVGYNSDWSNNATRIEALGVNHREMLDNPKIADIIRRICNGTAGADPFFNTVRR